ncbi:xenotropic and polytropic retrovirus receptor 1 homolog [Styela clava]
MKFGENLQAHLTPEWRSQYIDYEFLKTLLYDCREESPDAEITEEATVQRYYARFEEKFFAICDKELTKVNTFYAEKLAESTRKFATLQSELQAQKASLLKKGPVRQRRKSEFLIPTRKNVQVKTVKDLKLAFSEFYLSLILLQNYQELNFTGFRKILKKHDKMLETDKGCKWRQKYVETAPFYTDTHNSQLILKTETKYINDLEGGDRSKAMKRLRVPPLSEFEMYPRWTVFRVGLFLGILCMIFVVGIISAIILEVKVDPWLALDLYRPGLVLFLFLFFIGINTWGWRSAGVNHVLIFEIDPRNHLSHYHLFELAALAGILWAISGIFLIFGNLEPLSDHFPVYLNPGLLYATYLIFLLNPLPILYHKARFWLLCRMWRLFACGFYHVEFADFWLADQLNSLVSLYIDFEFVVCFYGFDGNIWDGWRGEKNLRTCASYSYGLRAVLACYPAWIRFIQCLRRFYDSRKWFPHFVNAGKYSTVFFKVLFNALFVLHFDHTGELNSVYFYLWLASLFISSCYTLAWDIKMDWGFLDKNAGENKWLREEIVYSYKAYYYFAIVEDFILRFSWVISVAITHTLKSTVSNGILKTVFVILEVFRRFIWNFFRLENEHLNNCGEFRAVRDISVAPLREDDLATLMRMMDDENGVEDYRRRVREGGSGGKSLGSNLSRKVGSSIRHNASSGVMLYVGSGGSDEEGTSTSAI